MAAGDANARLDQVGLILTGHESVSSWWGHRSREGAGRLSLGVHARGEGGQHEGNRRAQPGRAARWR
jgi:hypothetical protein